MFSLLGEQDYNVTDWSGGRTTQLFIWPEGADYVKRNFAFRISSATVEQEESVFTKLEGVHRFLTVLKGQLYLSFHGGEERNLEPRQVVEFEGDWDTKSVGRATDFNLMIKQGKGSLETRNFSGKQVMELEPGHHFYYLAGGSAEAAAEGKVLFGEAGQCFYVRNDKQECLTIVAEEAASVVIAEVTL